MKQSFKILCDFDGVLTDLREETERQKAIFSEKLTDEAGFSAQEVGALFDRAEKEMTQHPHGHGWRVNSRLAAYCNEDAFIRLNAVGTLFDDWAEQGDPLLVRGREKLSSQKASFFSLVHESYTEMTEETASGKRKPIDPEAAVVLKELLRRGVEIVIVSNSGTERICQILKSEGFDPVPHTPGVKASLRVRGGAQKFSLGTDPRQMWIGQYRVDVDRPKYREILLEEKPDIVVGDVFSLDLAMPFHLKQTTDELNHTRALLRLRDYSPGWATDFLSREGTEGGVLKRFDELLAL